MEDKADVLVLLAGRLDVWVVECEVDVLDLVDSLDEELVQGKPDALDPVDRPDVGVVEDKAGVQDSGAGLDV